MITICLHYRFTSVFANPGWYAEYLAVAAPYALIALAGLRSWPGVTARHAWPWWPAPLS